ARQLPSRFHAGSSLVSVVVELGLVWVGFLQRRLRLLCFFIVTALQVGIILTANLGFLNYLVLVLGILLLDDRFLGRIRRWLTPAGKQGEASLAPTKPRT